MLTFKNKENKGDWHDYPTLLNSIKEAGFKTYFISNQEVYGAWGNVVAALASQADKTFYNDARTSFFKTRKLDGDLLKYLDNILIEDNNNKFIIIHLLGNHADYNSRYPDNFSKFTDADIKEKNRDFLTTSKKTLISEYDNAILYTDNLLYKMINRIDKQKKNSYLLYLSDHGEEVYDERDFFGHTEKIGNRHMIEIPFILWTSELFKNNNFEKMNNIYNSLNNPYMTDDLMHTIFDLSSIHHKDYDPERSIINKKFNKNRPRIYYNYNYDKEMKNSTHKFLITRNFHKLWAHRVNHLKKLEECSSIYKGVELDLVFKQENGRHFLDITHPPAKSIGLTFERYLSYMHEKNLDVKLWLDLKNLNINNSNIINKHINILLKKYKFNKKNLVVESNKLKPLEYFSKHGFFTSYYLPYLKIDKMSEDEKTAKGRFYSSQILGSKIKAVSFSGHMVDFVTNYIHAKYSIKFLTWFPEKEITNPKDAVFLQKLADNPQIGIVLITQKSMYYYDY